MSKKPKYLVIKDAVIRYVNTREDNAFCIFLPEDPNCPKGIEARNEYARKLTEQTGIEHRASKVTNRLYFVARLIGVDEPWTIASQYFKLLTEGEHGSQEWQVSTIKVYPSERTFDLASTSGRDFCFRKAGVNAAQIYPEWIKKWPESNEKEASDEQDVDYDALREPEPVNLFEIKKVIFSNPCTIVFWSDGTKTVVRCSDTECYDPEKGIAMALMRKVYGPRHHYMKTLGPYIEEFWKAEEAKQQQLISAVESGRLNFADILRGATNLFTGKHIIDKVADKTAEELEEEENDED